MDKKKLEEIKISIAKTGRVKISGESIEKLEKIENIRYVYNPNPYLVHISSLNISVRPGEFIDLVHLVGSPEKVFSAIDVTRAVERGMLYGFSTIDDLSEKKLKQPKTKTKLEEYKENVGIVITEEGTPAPAEKVLGEENPFTKALEEETKKEEEEVERVTRKATRKK